MSQGRLRGGGVANITRDDLLAVADRYQIARATRALAEVKEAVSAWGDFAHAAERKGMPGAHAV